MTKLPFVLIFGGGFVGLLAMGAYNEHLLGSSSDQAIRWFLQHVGSAVGSLVAVFVFAALLNKGFNWMRARHAR